VIIGVGLGIDEPAHEVEAHATNARLVHFGEGFVINSGANRSDPACSAIRGPQRIDESTVVCPWQVACTITLRSNLSRSHSANSLSFPATHGVYFALGRVRKDVAWAWDLPACTLPRRLVLSGTA
jgi:hypothetical protein